MILTVVIPIEFVCLFGEWPGRQVPVAPSRTWPRVAAVVAGPRSGGLPRGMRRAGLWEAAALLEDESSMLQARLIVERRASSGWEPISVLDARYPHLLRKRLGTAAPPLLWARGATDALGARLCAIVGSRDLRPDEIKFAKAAGSACAHAGIGVVSGGARGADRLSGEGAIEAGGFVAHMLPGGGEPNLPGASAVSQNPDEGTFLTIRAFARNRWLYAAGEGAIIVASRFGAGGSWHGALGARRAKFGPMAVYVGPKPSSGNDALVRLGATPVRTGQDVADWLKSLPAPPLSLAI